MMERTKIMTALKGVRGRPPINLAELEQLLVRFSQLVVELSRIKEIEINPLLASPERLLALDARVILYDPATPESEILRPAIRPYPSQYIMPWTANDGAQLVIRPIRPEDEPALVRFHGTLSDRSVALRYFHAMSLSARVAHDRLTRICFIDYEREMALVAEQRDPVSSDYEIVGVGRLSKLRGSTAAEFALLVSDGHQGKGIGTALLERLVHVGRAENISMISGDVLRENVEMQRICEKAGFRLIQSDDEAVVQAVLQF
jgi:acetyltransferase